MLLMSGLALDPALPRWSQIKTLACPPTWAPLLWDEQAEALLLRSPAPPSGRQGHGRGRDEPPRSR